MYFERKVARGRDGFLELSSSVRIKNLLFKGKEFRITPGNRSFARQRNGVYTKFIKISVAFLGIKCYAQIQLDRCDVVRIGKENFCKVEMCNGRKKKKKEIKNIIHEGMIATRIQRRTVTISSYIKIFKSRENET